MRIVDVRREDEGGWASAVATVIWERTKRPAQTLMFSTPESTGSYLTVNPDAFLTAAALPAAYHFERTLTIEGRVCPTLLVGVEEAMALHHSWMKDYEPVRILAEQLDEPRKPSDSGSAAVMLSGGVDALASLRSNRRDFTPDHSSYFKRGIVLSAGFDAFEMYPGSWYWRRLEDIAQSSDLQLIAVSTNSRELEPSNHFFVYRYLAALLSATAHSLGGGVTHVAIASGGNPISEVQGTHPDLDHLFSSGAVQIEHHMADVDRWEKTRMIADWPAAQKALRVCTYSNRLPEGTPNCGRCEKCLRTILTLVAMGRLRDFDVFGVHEVSAEYLRENLGFVHWELGYYVDLVQKLEENGRADLSVVVKEKAAEAARKKNSLPRRLRRLERSLLGGFLRRAKRRFLG